MAPWRFTSAILEGRPIDVFNHGRMQRDFTFVDDVADGTLRALDHLPQRRPGSASEAPYRVYNVGSGHPVELLTFIGVIEDALHRKATLNKLPLQPGDVAATCADTGDFRRDTGFAARTSLPAGIRRFVDWYLAYRPQA
jgi:UDP-glucuronate 4-epimerase